MPKKIDESKLGFSSGYKGSTDSSEISYTVGGNVITGRYNEILKPGEAVTVRLELPEGYFVSETNKFVPFAISSYLLWAKFGKDDKVDVGFLYKGRSEPKDVVSLLIYLAD